MLLQANKHNDPNRTVLAVSSIILARLSRYRIETLTALRERVLKRQPGVDALILPSLSFLYLLGLVEYRPKTDSIEYTGP